jgi:hypothetical protein
MEQLEDSARCVPNASNWLRLLFHSAVCSSNGSYSCGLGARCDEAKNILAQIMSAESSRVAAPSAATGSAELSSITSLLLHYLSCKVRKVTRENSRKLAQLVPIGRYMDDLIIARLCAAALRKAAGSHAGR